MKRNLALALFLATAIAADIVAIGLLTNALDLSTDWSSFLRVLLGVWIGMYGPSAFARIWPKQRGRATA